MISLFGVFGEHLDSISGGRKLDETQLILRYRRTK